MLDDIENHLRDISDLARTYVLLRGSPLTVGRLLFDADRTARRFNYLGSSCEGVSVVLARNPMEADHLMADVRLSGRHHVARIRTEDALDAGFLLLPTFGAPHYTLVMGRAPGATAQTLNDLAALDVIPNPHYRGEFR